ncbi:hypothetical protein SULI_02095 [Saccharolobus solfataricus]|uniref:CRISPR-associated protein, MJ1666 family n=3 Tax=Saccharolobus solfataricus TaxID=2287 RepID=Q97VL7_SACS2|nr:hypothetical protein [Saccharolobus solfataricus]AAK42727.1 Hypothetical protein SSO2606 [Saccharolobus solfataricus P2]AKA72824.1 hypothetical protein SULB_0412 [Saccharolobus solfataricus]AKA75523.1 hypothetical protein SULC_0410 [Saccharolobus solfataricus]AKA78216.1 hypothetical protein SULA_0410 [Saccharolobus solfataricus]AZF67334.1 hypothetical protein SULG_02095 [Saccharolobus solfataricus]
MKILIIAPLTEVSEEENEIRPIEVTNWSNSPVGISSKYSFLAEKKFLEEERHEVKILTLVPTEIRKNLNVKFSNYNELVSNILEALKFGNDNIAVEVIPFEDSVSLGTSLFFSYLKIYYAIKTFLPSLIILDVSHSSSSFSTLVLTALDIAITDSLLTQQVENYIYAKVSKRNDSIQLISHMFKNMYSIKLSEYFLREMKIMKSENQANLPQFVGRAEFRRLGFCIENCYPLVVLHVLDGMDLEKLVSEEKIMEIVVNNLEIKDGKLIQNVELLEGATYYVLATHLVKRYKVKKPFSVDNVRNILNLTSPTCRRISNQIIDEMMIELNYLLRHLGLREGEYSLEQISNLLKQPLTEIIRKEESIGDILSRYKRECGSINLSGIGLDPGATIIKIDSDKIYVYYADECEDSVLSKVKDQMGD